MICKYCGRQTAGTTHCLYCGRPVSNMPKNVNQGTNVAQNMNNANQPRPNYVQGNQMNNNIPQNNGYVQPQQGYIQPQQGYIQPQQGYVQPQQGYVQPVYAQQNTVNTKKSKNQNVTYEQIAQQSNTNQMLQPVQQQQKRPPNKMLWFWMGLLLGIVITFLVMKFIF